nr:uncharacterized protein LOC129383732 [Dermacentor andersoni]
MLWPSRKASKRTREANGGQNGDAISSGHTSSSSSVQPHCGGCSVSSPLAVVAVSRCLIYTSAVKGATHFGFVRALFKKLTRQIFETCVIGRGIFARLYLGSHR